jgi:hypothetical protein
MAVNSKWLRVRTCRQLSANWGGSCGSTHILTSPPGPR